MKINLSSEGRKKEREINENHLSKIKASGTITAAAKMFR